MIYLARSTDYPLPAPLSLFLTNTAPVVCSHQEPITLRWGEEGIHTLPVFPGNRQLTPYLNSLLIPQQPMPVRPFKRTRACEDRKVVIVPTGKDSLPHPLIFQPTPHLLGEREV